jgi:hypothetical protein
MTEQTKSATRENYEVLIGLIDNILNELHKDKNRLLSESCEGLFIHFNELLDEENIREKVANNKWVMKQIAERNCKRHRLLVKLLAERFKLNRSLDTYPKSASATVRSLNIQEKIDKITVQIEGIIKAAEREYVENQSV